MLTSLHEDEDGKFHWLVDAKNLLENIGKIWGNAAAIELNGRAPYTSEALFIAGGESNDLKYEKISSLRNGKNFPCFCIDL